MSPLTMIHGYAHVAQQYGLEEAIFLDSLIFWYNENRANGRNLQDGRWWTYNSVSAWWSGRQIRRIIASCIDKGAMLTGNYSEDRRDRTLWYTPSDALLALYGLAPEGKCICQNGQMHLTETSPSSDQTGKCYKETCYNPCNTPYSPPQGEGASQDKKRGQETGPDLFDQFWAAYPKKKDKEKARRAWRRLNPGPELCQTMAAALERDKRSPNWQKDSGAYIPYASTWLNGRRWEDESGPPAPPCGGALRPEGGRWL